MRNAMQVDHPKENAPNYFDLIFKHRILWFCMGTISSYALSILLCMYLEFPMKKFSTYVSYFSLFFLIGIAIFVICCFCITPPDTTYEAGPAILTYFQLTVFYLMFILGFIFPNWESELESFSCALVAFVIAVAQLVYPCWDFHIGHGFFTVMGCSSVSLGYTYYDPNTGYSIWVILFLTFPFVLVVLLMNFPKQTAYICSR